MKPMMLGVAIGAALWAPLAASGQPLSFRYEASDQPFTPLHSYAHGELGDDYVFFFGGISGFGLHKINGIDFGNNEPIFRLKQDYNQQVRMVDRETGTLHSGDLSHLSPDLQHALLMTNPSAFQDGDTLHVYGGYGPLPDESDVMTRDTVVSVDLVAVRDALLAGDPVPASAFSMGSSPEVQSTGAEIFELDHERFVLYGGAAFEGDYLYGPENYKERAHIFDCTVSLSAPVTTITPVEPFGAEDLHRRDLNGEPATFVDGENVRRGFIVTGGVFQFGFRPYENPVVWFEGDAKATMLSDVIIKMNQYHAPSLSFWDESAARNRLVLMGGITYYTSVDAPSSDVNAPWTTTVTEVTFDGPEFVSEIDNGARTPNPISNGELILNDTLPTLENGQVRLDMLPPNEVYLGSIYGGVRAVEEGQFPETYASSEVTDVYMVKGVRGDINESGKTDSTDLANLIAAWGSGGGYTPADLNWDGAVNATDLGVLISFWGNDTPG